MENRIHFISGLPRAGSTLLAAVLRQNPRFHAAMTSPVGSLYMAMESATSRRNETSVFLDAAQRGRCCAACSPAPIMRPIRSRATRVAASDGMVGYALDALREACFGPVRTGSSSWTIKPSS